MPHTLPVHEPAPVYKDRGLGLAAPLLVVLPAFSLGPSNGQIGSLSVAAPFLAAALVERATRVLWAGAVAVLVFVVTAQANDAVWDTAAKIRFGAVIVGTFVAYWVAVTRIRAI